MAVKGTIEKELSCIMGIPSSTEDIGTYDDLIKRLEENREFRVKVLKNDTEKFLWDEMMCTDKEEHEAIFGDAGDFDDDEDDDFDSDDEDDF